MSVVTRFAPSPTGALHLGGARTALFNWLLARNLGGKFVLRVEDTDRERSTKASADGILTSLRWLGLDWDEGPYFQSERLPLYRRMLSELEAGGFIYPAFDTPEELEAIRTKAQLEKRNPIYDRNALRLSKDEVAGRMARGDAFVWRFKVRDEGVTEVPELLMGSDKTSFPNAALGDFIITRPGTLQQPGMPLYNFVCAVDDGAMGITHVIRGVEHFSNAARQVLLHQALGNEVPQFVHLPLITKNGRKMSKRDPEASGQFPVSIEGRRDLGYVPEAILNHLVLLGWSHPANKEILDVSEMVATFDLSRLSKSNANFDEQKLFHFNALYIKEMSLARLVELVMPYLKRECLPVERHSPDWIAKCVDLERGRCRLLSEFGPALRYYFFAPEVFELEAFRVPRETALIAIDAAYEQISATDTISEDAVQKKFDAIVAERQLKYKDFGASVRLALTGGSRSPSLPELVVQLGKEESLCRLERLRGQLEEVAA